MSIFKIIKINWYIKLNFKDMYILFPSDLYIYISSYFIFIKILDKKINSYSNYTIVLVDI